MTDPRELKPSPDPAVQHTPYVRTDLRPGVTVAWLCEAIWEAESQFGLLDWVVSGVKPWQAGRFAIFQSLSSALGLFENTPDETPQGWLGRLRLHGRLLRGALAENPFVGSERYDALVFEGARSVGFDTERVCAYTHHLANGLSREGKRVQLLDTHFAGIHSKSPDRRRRFMDAAGIESGLRFRLTHWTPAATELAFLSTVESHLAKVLATNVDLRWLLSPSVKRFMASYSVYRRLLEKRRPSEIYCVCAHVNLAPLVAAAKHLGIRVTEVQHAVISRYHFGYSYPGAREGSIEYLPDRLLMWRGRWNDIGNPPCAVEATPPHWEPLILAHGGAPKRPRLIVVLSQPPIAYRLAQAILERGNQLKPFEIIFKPHPAELRDPRLRAVLAELRKQDNVRIAECETLYDLLPHAEYQVGVYSTALYEGMQLGCRTLLVPLPGIEHMAHLVASGGAEMLDDFLGRWHQRSAGEPSH